MNYTSKNISPSQNINRFTTICLPIRNIFIIFCLSVLSLLQFRVREKGKTFHLQKKFHQHANLCAAALLAQFEIVFAFQLHIARLLLHWKNNKDCRHQNRLEFHHLLIKCILLKQQHNVCLLLCGLFILLHHGS